jgi:class 3 adenylate cyclase
MIRAHEHLEATLADHAATAGPLSGVDLIDLGPRRLRDIAKAVELFQVRAPGLRTSFRR